MRSNLSVFSAHAFSMLTLSAFTLMALPVHAASDADSSRTLNDRILDYCNENLGKSVGNGQCAALATQALRAAGARPRGQSYPAWNDYVWGKQVCLIEGTPDGTKVSSGSLKDVLPGDIAQFSNAKFISMHAAHHTAIVDFINDRRLGLIQQNGRGEKKNISKASVRVDKLSQGWIRFYRPLPK